MSQEADYQQFDQWAIVDVMGHQRYVGRVTEQIIAGQGFVRVDIPPNDEVAAWTKLIGASSIYAITPISEDIARSMSAQSANRPVYSYELPRQIDRDGDDEIPC